MRCLIPSRAIEADSVARLCIKFSASRTGARLSEGSRAGWPMLGIVGPVGGSRFGFVGGGGGLLVVYFRCRGTGGVAPAWALVCYVIVLPLCALNKRVWLQTFFGGVPLFTPDLHVLEEGGAVNFFLRSPSVNWLFGGRHVLEGGRTRRLIRPAHSPNPNSECAVINKRGVVSIRT